MHQSSPCPKYYGGWKRLVPTIWQQEFNNQWRVSKKESICTWKEQYIILLSDKLANPHILPLDGLCLIIIYGWWWSLLLLFNSWERDSNAESPSSDFMEFSGVVVACILVGLNSVVAKMMGKLLMRSVFTVALACRKKESQMDLLTIYTWDLSLINIYRYTVLLYIIMLFVLPCQGPRCWPF